MTIETQYGWTVSGECIWCSKKAATCRCRHPDIKVRSMDDHRYIRRKNARKELQDIEKILHPEPTMNGLDILHRHHGNEIFFSAWKGDDPHNGACREYIVDREMVLKDPRFYDNHRINLVRLTLSDDEILEIKSR